jgi:hypothetical protein
MTALDRWIKELGLSTTEVYRYYDAAVRENGVLLNLLLRVAENQISFPEVHSVQPVTIEEVITRIHSADYAVWLLSQPEPTPDELKKILKACRDLLPNIRQHFLQAAKKGPIHKRGGRHKELADPKLKREICEEIKSLREPESKLSEIYGHLALKYKVSATTIKRIWLERERRSMTRK